MIDSSEAQPDVHVLLSAQGRELCKLHLLLAMHVAGPILTADF